MSSCNVPGCANARLAVGLCSKHYAKKRKYGSPIGGREYARDGESALQWVADHVASPEGVGCVPWPFKVDDKGYGRFNAHSGSYAAHRYVCERKHGAPPSPKHHASHSCGKGTEACVAWWHLRWDTAKGNLADRDLHGTMNQGERHGNSKLTDAEVKFIRSTTLPRAQVALEVGVTPEHVRRIQRREAWKHVK